MRFNYKQKQMKLQMNRDEEMRGEEAQLSKFEMMNMQMWICEWVCVRMCVWVCVCVCVCPCVRVCMPNWPSIVSSALPLSVSASPYVRKVPHRIHFESHRSVVFHVHQLPISMLPATLIDSLTNRIDPWHHSIDEPIPIIPTMRLQLDLMTQVNQIVDRNVRESSCLKKDKHTNKQSHTTERICGEQMLVEIKQSQYSQFKFNLLDLIFSVSLYYTYLVDCRYQYQNHELLIHLKTNQGNNNESLIWVNLISHSCIIESHIVSSCLSHLTSHMWFSVDYYS